MSSLRLPYFSLVVLIVLAMASMVAQINAPPKAVAPVRAASASVEAPHAVAPAETGRSIKAALFETAIAACSGSEGCVVRVFEAAFGNECRRLIGREMVSFYRFHEEEPPFLSVEAIREGYVGLWGESLFVQDALGAFIRKRWLCYASRTFAPTEDHKVAVWY